MDLAEFINAEPEQTSPLIKAALAHATSASLVDATALTSATVNKSLDHLRKLGIVSELTKRQRGRVFSYRRYVKELSTGTEPMR